MSALLEDKARISLVISVEVPISGSVHRTLLTQLSTSQDFGPAISLLLPQDRHTQEKFE